MRVSDAIARFLDSIVAVRRPNTHKTYRVALEQFADFVGATPVDQLTAKHINDFVATLKGHAPATILNRVTALALFYRFAFLNELLDLDSRAREQLTETLKQLRPRFARLPKTVDNDVIASLIVAIEQIPLLPSTATPGENKRHTLRQLRNRAIVLALQWSGMRVGELVALRRADLDWGKHTTKVTGKNDSQRIVYFDPSAWHAIKAYLSQRADGATGRALGSLPVFARHDSRAGDKILPLTTKSVQEMFAVLGKRIGLPFPVTPHVLRHSFARNLLESSGNLVVVQDALGHQSPETTRIYVPLSEKRVRDAVRNMYREKEE